MTSREQNNEDLFGYKCYQLKVNFHLNPVIDTSSPTHADLLDKMNRGFDSTGGAVGGGEGGGDDACK